MPKEDQEDQRETFGLLLENKVFLLHSFMTGFFLVTFCIYTFGNFWEIFYRLSKWATIGLIIGNTLGTFGTTINTASWILIDMNSWLDSTICIMVVSVTFLVCGMHFLIYIFHGISILEKERVKLNRETLQVTGNGDEYIEDEDEHSNLISKKDAVWISILTAMNFFQGILAFLVLIFKCITLDGGSPTLTN